MFCVYTAHAQRSEPDIEDNCTNKCVCETKSTYAAARLTKPDIDHCETSSVFKFRQIFLVCLNLGKYF